MCMLSIELVSILSVTNLKRKLPDCLSKKGINLFTELHNTIKTWFLTLSLQHSFLPANLILRLALPFWSQTVASKSWSYILPACHPARKRQSLSLGFLSIVLRFIPTGSTVHVVERNTVRLRKCDDVIRLGVDHTPHPRTRGRPSTRLRQREKQLPPKHQCFAKRKENSNTNVRYIFLSM